MDISTFLVKTIALMKELHVSIRDTYNQNHNFDDWYSNGDYNGPRLLKMEWVNTAGYPETKINKIYELSGYQSVAYDAYCIAMPNRYKNNRRDDAIIHELVHFLQHNTVAEDKCYIKFTGQNYDNYLAQRVELEAHAVQILYILRENLSHCNKHLNIDDQKFVKQTLIDISNGADLSSGFSALRLCKDRQLI